MGEPCCGPCCGPCCYYRSGLVIASQILSIVALITSFGWYWPFLMGIIVVVIQFVLLCTRVPKAVIWVLVFASLIPAALNFYAGYAIVYRDPYGIKGDDDYIYPFCVPAFSLDLHCSFTKTPVSITTYVSGVLWVISGVLDLVYLLNGDDDDGEEDEAVAVAVNFPEDV